MRIPIRVGTDFFGHLQQEDGSVLATRCFFINYLPIIPLGTYRLAGAAAAPAPFSFKSLFATMFKVWGFIGAAALAAYGLAYHTWNRAHPEMPFITGVSGLLFGGVYASWLFLGHRARTPLRWGVVGGFAALTLAVLVIGAVTNLGQSSRDRLYGEGELPPADIPFSISVMKNLPDAPKSGGPRPVSEQGVLKKGEPVLVDLPSGTAMAVVAAQTSSDVVEVTTQSGGAKVFRVSRERLYLAK
jgi:hypothetical protein